MEGDGPGSAIDIGEELGATRERYLLSVARQALTKFLLEGSIQPLESKDSVLLQPCAVFVSLWRRDSGELRGCRGEPRARRPLLEAVALMAIAAATDDPRFMPIGADELPLLTIEINLLTPPHLILPDQIEIGQHGLLIEGRENGALLLPEVALRHGMNLDELLAALCAKAGLPDHAWRDPHCNLYAFESLVLVEEAQPLAGR